jgi:hypothetical protein
LQAEMADLRDFPLENLLKKQQTPGIEPGV